MDCCECGNELSCSVKCGELLDFLRVCWVLKEDSVTWSFGEIQGPRTPKAAGGTIILRWNLERYAAMVRTGSVWLHVQSCGAHCRHCNRCVIHIYDAKINGYFKLYSFYYATFFLDECSLHRTLRSMCNLGWVYVSFDERKNGNYTPITNCFARNFDLSILL